MRSSEKSSTILDTDLSFLTLPELLDSVRMITDEIELRCMQDAGEMPRVVCGETGNTCVWCKARCEDRRAEE